MRAGDYVVNPAGLMVCCTSSAAAFAHKDEWAHQPATLASDAYAKLFAASWEMAGLCQAFVHAHLDWTADGRDARLAEYDRIAHEMEEALRKAGRL